jgi:glycosyltransferase involved in cell wall biosynthesis
MKITHVITTITWGGAEKQLLLLMREQVASGIDVSLIFLKNSPELLQEIERIGINEILDLSQDPFLKKIFKVRQFARKKDSLFHAHLPLAEIICAFSIRPNRLVISRHVASQFITKLPKFLSTVASRFTTNRCGALIAISEATKDFMIANREMAKRTSINVVSYGFDVLDGNANKGQDKSIEKFFEKTDNIEFLIGTIARITEGKDYPTLLNAFKLILSQIKNSHLLVIGDGELASQMKTYAGDLEIASKITWLGRIPNVSDYLELMDLFMFTSESEGFGLVLLEAMSAGIPIVASRNSAILEVLGSDYEYFCETGNPQQFAQKAVEIHDNNLESSIIKRNFEHLVKFNAAQMERNIRNVYFSLVD